MAETVIRGPSVNYGSLLDGRVEPTDGPDIEYQGSSFPDPRYTGLNIGEAVTRIPGFLSNPYVVMTDCIPQSSSNSVIAVAGPAASNTGFTLVSTSVNGSGTNVCSLAPAAPLMPFGSQTVTTALALDFGAYTGNFTASSNGVGVTDSTVFYNGQWIVVGGVGNSAKSACLITQVTGTPNATNITVSPAPSGTVSNAPIMDANLLATQYYPDVIGTGAPPVPTAVGIYSWAGVSKLLNPLECGTRNITVFATTGAVGGTVVVSGYDIYNVPMTESLTVTAGVTSGKKAFKYLLSVTPNFTDSSHNYSVGIGNIAGFHLRSDKWEYTNIFFNAAFATSSNGWTAAAAPASGDVRGTIDVSNASGFNSAFNGSRRLAIMMSVPLWNIINATPTNTVPLFGQAQT